MTIEMYLRFAEIQILFGNAQFSWKVNQIIVRLLSYVQADENQKTADRLYELKMRELDQRACELQIAEEACRKAVLQATKDFNLAQVKLLLYSVHFLQQIALYWNYYDMCAADCLKSILSRPCLSAAHRIISVNVSRLCLVTCSALALSTVLRTTSLSYGNMPFSGTHQQKPLDRSF
jgi:hypothetical protein